MATKKTAEIPEGYEEVMVPKADANEDKDLFVGINGKNWVMPRGKKVIVPDYVARAIEQSEAAKEILEETKGTLQKLGR